MIRAPLGRPTRLQQRLSYRGSESTRLGMHKKVTIKAGALSSAVSRPFVHGRRNGGGCFDHRSGRQIQIAILALSGEIILHPPADGYLHDSGDRDATTTSYHYHPEFS
jgi:hypothetical protein